MGEIIIKVPGDIKEVFEIKEGETIPIDKIIKKLEKLNDITFLQTYFPKVKHSVEVEEVTEEELHLQGD
jgi:hypothetical protein